MCPISHLVCCFVIRNSKCLHLVCCGSGKCVPPNLCGQSLIKDLNGNLQSMDWMPPLSMHTQRNQWKSREGEIVWLFRHKCIKICARHILTIKRPRILAAIRILMFPMRSNFILWILLVGWREPLLMLTVHFTRSAKCVRLSSRTAFAWISRWLELVRRVAAWKCSSFRRLQATLETYTWKRIQWANYWLFHAVGNKCCPS